MIDSTYEDKLYQTSKFAGAVRYNVPRICAALLSPRGPSLALRAIHLVSRLRRVNHMCSRTVSDTANRLLKRTDSEGSSSVSREKSSVRSPFRSGQHVGNLRQTIQGKGVIHKRVETAGVYPLAPPRGAANPPAEIQRKTPRPLGRTRLRQFVSPAQPVLKKTAARIGRTR